MAVFHQKKITHGKGHQMMTFRAGCEPLVHVNAASQKKRMRICVIKLRGRQFTANCCTGMADLDKVVSQARGIKFYGATAYHGQHFSCHSSLKKSTL